MPTILTLLFFSIRVLLGRLFGWKPKPIKLRLGNPRSRAHAFLFPDGRLLAGVGGASPDDPDDEDEGEPDDEEHEDDEEGDEDVPPEAWDRDRAAKTIRAQRKEKRKLERERKAADRRAQEAEDRARALEAEQESETETARRERDEAREEANRARSRADRLTVDAAVRDAAIEAGVEPKRVGRLLKLVDRDDLTVEDGEVDGAEEAVADVLADFPEFAAATPPPPDPPDDEEHEDDEEGDDVPTTAKPDRRRKPKPLNAEQVKKLAKDDPEKFNEMFDAGKIPASALGGK